MRDRESDGNYAAPLPYSVQNVSHLYMPILGWTSYVRVSTEVMEAKKQANMLRVQTVTLEAIATQATSRSDQLETELRNTLTEFQKTQKLWIPWLRTPG